MAERIVCAGCGRTANALFAKCPSCGAPLRGTAGGAGPEPRTTKICVGCGRVHGAGFAKCPFCGAPGRSEPTDSGAVSRVPANGPSASATVRDYAAIAVQAMASSAPFVHLDLHPASILALDLFFDVSWGDRGVAPGDDAWRPNPAQRAAIVNLGVCFGEILRRDLGGAWEDDAAQGSDPVVARLVLPGGMRCFPVSRAWKRMQSGASESFETMHAGLRRMAGVVPSVAELDGWLDHARRFEEAGRRDLAARFYDRAEPLGTDAATHERIDALRRRGAERESAHPTPPQEPPPALPMSPAPAAGLPDSVPPLAPEMLAELVSGRDAMQRGAHGEALAAFDRALAVDPAAKEALLGRAGALLSLGRAVEARVWLDTFAMRADAEPARTFLAAIAADDAGDAPAAHELFARAAADGRLGESHRARALSRSKELASDPRVRARAIERIPELGDVVRAYQALCAEHPEFAEGWRELGVGLSMLGRGDEALSAFDRAIAAQPTEPQGHDHRAVTLARLGRTDAAIAALEAGLRHCPGSAALRFRAGIFLATSGRTTDAFAAFDDVVRWSPCHPEVWASVADLYLREGRTAEGIDAIRRFLASNPGRVHPRVQAARERLWALENPGRTRDVGRASALRGAAVPAFLARDFAGAAVLLEASAVADPIVGETWLNLGSCLAALGRTGEALAAFERAESILGATGDVTQGEVAALLALGRADDAVRCHDRGLALGKPDAAALLSKALTLLRVGRRAEAAPILQRLVARDPANQELRDAYTRAAAAGG
ncbi:MAG: tetratricopeptide repeat protein [Planctomycetes bacterium]|nr:tetratricopeptide repeat protein [Planctomycetota bacterium]